MLSRIAESLYWIGRYIERAEDTARILDVHVHYLLEGPLIDEDLACRNLLAAMGVPAASPAPDGLFNAKLVTELLAFDEANPSSIVSSLTAARANARGVSEAISSEMWEALNTSYNALPGQVAIGRGVGPYTFFRYVRERAAIMAGLTDSTMSRDDAWRFLVIGRSLERIDMLARLLSTGLHPRDGDGDDVDWVILLRSCSAHEAFLRTYHREVEPILAAEFLLLDRLFPRSIFCAVSTAEQCLADLDPRYGRAGMADEARRVLGLVRTNLEFRRIEDLLSDLGGQLRNVQTGCSAASAALAARYFRQTRSVEWVSEGPGIEVAAADGSTRMEALPAPAAAGSDADRLAALAAEEDPVPGADGTAGDDALAEDDGAGERGASPDARMAGR
ncbi:alpha-E domain-containing protein [Acidiferrimicrobium sp. IK]|uniref:alpha-E domain-containing protein n=1 Tax=Acidiferrimicrobium sp. IK TaxID=2871700 RepID=UPI0021CB1619|nr:alpha-E domain-containing protein [Acidiferrimicrobium sp. IK]MCU4183606.1 alpha-E domain-containing protein [Acidiferrimicrobium sp. IK]